MLRKLIEYITVPKLGYNNTENEVYQQYAGYAYSDVNGNGGQVYFRSLSPIGFVNLAPGPTLKLNNPSVTGNVPETIGIAPLTDEDLRAV